MPGSWLRVLLLAEANWTPMGKVILPVEKVAVTLGMSKTTVQSSINGLIDTRILRLLKPAKRPLAPGGAGKGEAALYDLPGRLKAHANEREMGDFNYCGFWKVWSQDLRAVAEKLGHAAARVWVCAVLPCNRDKHGAPQNNEPMPLSGGKLAKLLPGMAARTGDRAIRELCELGLIRIEQPASGRRAATYVRTGFTVTEISRGKPKRRSS
jgi:predicted transcriptional regulator